MSAHSILGAPLYLFSPIQPPIVTHQFLIQTINPKPKSTVPTSLYIQNSKTLKSVYNKNFPNSNSPLLTTTNHYNSLIRTHIESHNPQLALLLFHDLLSSEHTLLPDEFTFPLILKACAHLSVLRVGEQIHCMVLKSPFIERDNIYIHTSLINMYLECGKLHVAHHLFETMSERNTVTWNSMISGFAKSGDMNLARRYFDEMPVRNIITWNALLAGYVKADMSHEALMLFLELQVSGTEPDESTMVSLISVISDLGLLDLGRKAHGYVTRKKFSLDGALGVALISMYTKYGTVSVAYGVFLSVTTKNIGHWTCMIGGFAAHGLAKSALLVFSEMLSSGIRPNYVTFIGVLNACSHERLVGEGLKYFNLMRTFDIEPRIQHYGCLVDLLGRLGLVEESLELIRNLPMEPGFVVWSTLLSACRIHGNVEIAEIAAKKLVELEPKNGSCYVLLSNIYAETERWEDSRKIRKMMEERGVVKVSGRSWIEVGGRVHEFVAGDMFHVRTQEICCILDELKSNMGCAELESVAILQHCNL